MDKKIPIIVPESMIPVKMGEIACTCPCQKKPVKLIYRKGQLCWEKRTGDAVKKGDILCKAIVENRTLHFLSPENGVLAALAADSSPIQTGDVLGYILPDKN